VIVSFSGLDPRKMGLTWPPRRLQTLPHARVKRHCVRLIWKPEQTPNKPFPVQVSPEWKCRFLSSMPFDHPTHYDVGLAFSIAPFLSHMECPFFHIQSVLCAWTLNYLPFSRPLNHVPPYMIQIQMYIACSILFSTWKPRQFLPFAQLSSLR